MIRRGSLLVPLLLFGNRAWFSKEYNSHTGKKGIT